MIDIQEFVKGATSYEGPWIPRELACFLCEAWLEVPGPCPDTTCEGSRLEDASDAEFFCPFCLHRQRRSGVCETSPCEMQGKPLREFSERTFNSPAEEQLASAAFAAEERRQNRPS